MVQFKPVETEYLEKFRSVTSAKTNNYWKLGLYSYNSFTDKTAREFFQTLRDKGYECRENISRPDFINNIDFYQRMLMSYEDQSFHGLQVFYQATGSRGATTGPYTTDAIGRYQRGLLSYDRCSVHELQAFCEARGLPGNYTGALHLARVLRRADDLITFPRFFELPAEIRNVIYKYSFSDFETFKDKHVQPPLTLASRQLRFEALPLFYEVSTFELGVTSHQVTRGVVQPGPLSIQLHPSSFRYMPAANFRRIKKFDLHWRCFATGDTVKVAVRFSATSEPKPPSLMELTLQDALGKDLESSFGTIENARKIMEEGRRPLTMSISGDPFNVAERRSTRPGLYVNIGTLALQNVGFD
jgi:hypothetical protein